MFPESVAIDINTSLTMSPLEAIQNHGSVRFTLTLEGIHTDFKDVALFLKKKKGFGKGKIAEESLVDLTLGGKGMSVCL